MRRHIFGRQNYVDVNKAKLMGAELMLVENIFVRKAGRGDRVEPGRW